MFDWKTWYYLLWEIVLEFRHSLQREVEKFTFALENRINELVSQPLHPDWRKQMAHFLLHWEGEGYRLTPRSLVILEWWIVATSKKRGFWPPREPPPVASYTVGPTDNDLPDVAPAAETAATPEPSRAKAPETWPALTPGEKEAAQESTGLPWWYPVQPRNRADGVWQRHAEDLGNVAREKLLAFYQEVAALGRQAQSIADRSDPDLEPLLDQREKVQAAYDAYIQIRTEIHREWTRYLTTEWLIGPEVLKVFEKIQNALPNRVGGFKSPFDEKLKAAQKASHAATVKKRQKTEAAYTALVWTDRVITAIEVASLIFSAKAVVTKAFEKAIAKGLSRAAARRIAIAYGVGHIATAAASAAVVGGVLPEILVAAGLNEGEVRAGLAVFTAFFTIAGVRTTGKRRSGQGAANSDKSAKDFLKHVRMRAGKASEAGRAYPHKQVYIRKSKGQGYWKLDYYDPLKGEIVSFKDTQLANIKVKSAIGYLNELVRKYQPGRMIADVPSTSRKLVGTQLKGTMFLEVPVQRKPIPQAVLDAATKRDIQIRDVEGRVY
jgi:hypothetical protein